MDPSSSIVILLTVAKRIKDAVDRVKTNIKKCSTLSNRIQLLCPALQGMTSSF
jgi:hypothetical protein